jgi:MHS family proline/betaine transporter-like MFS transporter
MGILSSLTRQQKEAVGLLQIGTFLEYFDLMLYVHMAVLLNELFFPKTDPHTAALLSAFAFCSTFVLRPFGALIFGYIGDNIGRKTTVIITTMMMAVSCIIMANLPTYAQVGITATWLVTICRITQGLSSMGEMMGAQIYITEITKPPVQYPAVSFISVASSLGASVALGVGVLVTTTGFNWRIAFWVGAAVAMVGSIARTKLRETPEFVDMKRRLKNDIEKNSLDATPFTQSQIRKMNQMLKEGKKEKISGKTLTAFSLVYCGWPLTFLILYMYFNPFLKEHCGYSAEDIIFHNFILSLIMLFSEFFWSKLSYKIHPLKILKGRGIGFLILSIPLPIMILYCTSSFHIFILQFLIMAFQLGYFPAPSVFIKHFPVFRRFTATSFLYALTRAVMYVITSFGIVYLTEWFGYYGLWVMLIPITLAYLWGTHHFEKLEEESGVRLKKTPRISNTQAESRLA